MSRSVCDRVTKGHRFCCGSRFIQERRVRDVERGQVGDHGLEIEQGLEPALRDLGLVRRVGGVPAGVFENVSLDDGRHDAIGIAGADEAPHDFVLLRDGAQFCERFLFRLACGKIERVGQANVFWNGGIDEIVQILEANLGQHGVDFFVVRPDMAADETAQFPGRFRRRKGGFLILGRSRFLRRRRLN